MDQIGFNSIHFAANASEASQEDGVMGVQLLRKIDPVFGSLNKDKASRSLGHIYNLYCILMNKTGDILKKLATGRLKLYQLEKVAGISPKQAVEIRRQFLVQQKALKSTDVDNIPYKNAVDYGKVWRKNGENIIGFQAVPIGLAGPLNILGRDRPSYLPIATTEGALTASLTRGCNVLNQAMPDGIQTAVWDQGMTRAPVVKMPDLYGVKNLVNYLSQGETLTQLAEIFNNTTRHGRWIGLEPLVAGSQIHLRIRAASGQAMGMNMLTYGSEAVVRHLQQVFPGMQVISLSGNCCTDKKISALNWTRGRGKKAVAQAILSDELVKKKLNVTSDQLIELNREKNLVGSAVAGVLGGYNAQAANIVAALFLATGQDLGQIGTSSLCLTDFDRSVDGRLRVSVTLPNLEVGTVGGGTELATAQANLRLMGLDPPARSNQENSKNNDKNRSSEDLAGTIAAAVLAGELSLMASLAEGSLMSAHLTYNRGASK